MDEINLKEACKMVSCKVSEIGLRVKEARISRKITQQDLAFYCFMDKGQVSALERGYSGNVTLLTIFRISLALDISADYLFTGRN